MAVGDSVGTSGTLPPAPGGTKYRGACDASADCGDGVDAGGVAAVDGGPPPLLLWLPGCPGGTG